MAGLLSYQLTPQATTGQFLGDTLSGLGAGLLAYGQGGQARQQAGLLGLQALQAAPERRNDYAMQQLQKQALQQNLTQSGISNALGNAQTLAMLNWRNSKLGLPQLSLQDLTNNPVQSLATPTAQQQTSSLPQSAGPTPQQAPQTITQTPLPPMGGSGSGPTQLLSSPPAMPAPSQSQLPQQPMQSAPQTSNGIGALPSGGLTTDVAANIQNDALFNKDFADMELKLVQAGIPYQQAQAYVKSLGEKQQYFGPNGVTPLPGSVQAGAQVAGANSYATSQGQLPATMAAQSQRGQIERMNDANKASITPYVETLQTGPSQFQQVNTNQLSASRGAAPGNMQYTPEQSSNQKVLSDYKGALTDAANEGQTQNVQLNQMLDTMKGFNPSKLAPYKMAAAGWLNSVGLSGDETNKALSNYQEFSKIATKVSTSQARTLGAREAASVIQMVVKNNPNAEMTPAAITDMLNAMKATNDYALQKNQAASQFYQQNGTLNGFDSQYQSQHPPVESLAPYLRPEQLTGELGKAALPFLSNAQLLGLAKLHSGGQ